MALARGSPSLARWASFILASSALLVASCPSCHARATGPAQPRARAAAAALTSPVRPGAVRGLCGAAAARLRERGRRLLIALRRRLPQHLSRLGRPAQLEQEEAQVALGGDIAAGGALTQEALLRHGEDAAQ
jgi:hypothetical protein